MSDFSWITSENVTSSEIGDELALLEPATGQYFTLNQTGAVVWRVLSEPHTLSEVVAEVAKKFDVTAAQCNDDVNALIAQLSEAGLIRKV